MSARLKVVLVRALRIGERVFLGTGHSGTVTYPIVGSSVRVLWANSDPPNGGASTTPGTRDMTCATGETWHPIANLETDDSADES